MKKAVFLFAFMLCYSAYSQSLQLFNIDPSSFPVIKAKFYAFGTDDKQISNISASDFDLLEDGVKRNVLSVSCPPFQEPKALSSVLTIDVSGSMGSGGGLTSAKSAATAWINALPLGKSECAITSFSNISYLVQDFTTDRNKLLNSIAQLTPTGGTNYDSAYLQTMVGGLEVVKRGIHNRIMVFLTDGQPSNEPQTQKIIDLAHKYGVVVYCITLRMPAPQCLKDISTNTGGLCYENIATESEAKDIYLRILNIAQSVTPCTIEWQSEVQCPKYSVALDLTLKTINANSKNSYIMPKSAVAYLEVKPSGIILRDVTPGTSRDTIIVIKAINADFNITDIIGTNPNFSITPKAFSLKANESKTLTITYAPTDSLINFCTFDIVNDICKTSIYARGGFRKQKMKNSPFKVTNPNGGERFGIGTDTVITWEGCSPNEKVTLDYSIDQGTTWRQIAQNVTGLKYEWKNIPNTPSNQCLIKASLEKTNDEKIFGLGSLASVIYSPDGSMLASGGSGGIFIWDLASGDTILSIRKNTRDVQCLAFSPDGSKVASGSEYEVKIWDVSNGALISTLTGYKSYVHSVNFSPDGSKIVGCSEDHTIKIWDVNSGQLIRNINGDILGVYSVCFSPDGSIIASGSFDRTIKIWDVSTGSLIRTFNGHTRSVVSVCFSPDGNTIASGSFDNTIKLWDVSTGTLIRTFNGHTSSVVSVCLSPDGNTIASGSFDNTIKLWDLSTGKLIRTFNGHTSSIVSVCFSPDGSEIASGGDITIKIWDVNTGAEIKTLTGHTYSITSISYSQVGSKIASGSWNTTINIWDVITGKKTNTLKGHTNTVNSVNFNPDGSKIASGSNDYTVKLWNVSTGAEISTLKGHKDKVSSVSFSPDGSKVASSGSMDGRIKIWDVNTSTLIKTITVPTYSIFSLCYSPDGSMIASGSNEGSIKLWDVNTGAEIRSLTGHNKEINSISFSADGSKLVSGSSDKKVKIWDVNTGAEIRTLTGHTNYVMSVCFSPDGKTIASAGDYYADIILWDANTGIAMETLTGHTRAVTSVVFSPDGSKLASGSWDGTIRLWNIDEIAPTIDDVSDSVWSIIAPQSATKDIDMLKVLVGSVKDSIVQSFLVNMSDFISRIDSISITGANADQFAVVSGMPPYILDASQTKNVEFRFMPTSIGIKTAKINVYAPVGTITTNIVGEGVIPLLSVENKMIDFGKVTVGKYKDTVAVVTIKNIGTSQLNITNTKHGKPNDIDFITLSGGGAFSLAVGETKVMTLRFSARDEGLTNGTLDFEYNGVGSPAKISLLGEGVKDKPQITTNSANKVLICSNTLLDTIKIWNSGVDILNVTSIKITGTDVSNFKIIKNPAPVKLSSSDTALFILSFVPKSNGIKKANLTVMSNSTDSTRLIIPLSYNYMQYADQFVNQIDMGGIFLTSTKDTAFTITNASTSTNRYVVNSSNLEFTLTPTDITLAPGQSGKINLHYNGTITQDTTLNFTITITDTICGQSASINVIADIWNYQNLILECGSVQANAGDRVNIPIYLRNGDYVKYTSIKSIDLELSFNSTLLLPVGYKNQSKEINEKRVLSLSLPIENYSKGILAKIKMLAALGNAEETDLIMQNIRLVGGTAVMDSVNGKFTLLDICREGGNRLVNPNGTVQLYLVKPNPSSDKATIEYELSEHGRTKLYITNIIGEIVKTVFDTDNKSYGLQKADIDLSGLPSGKYLVILQTPLVVKTISMEVIK